MMPTSDDAPPSTSHVDDRRRTWRQRAVVLAVLALPVFVFFAPSILDGKAPGGFDLIYLGSPWRDSEPRPSSMGSPVQVDQAEQLPWVDSMWEQIGAGSWPGWSPNVGGGIAAGSNPVFASYSVFTVLGVPFSPAVGLVVRAVLSVLVAELFLYAFLRRLTFRRGAAVLGAVAYAFSGTPVAFYSRNAIPLLLPVLLYVVDRLAERVSPGRVLAVAAAVGALWLEGFPAMLVHAVLIGGAWWVLRVGMAASWHLRSWAVVQRWLRSGVAFAAAIALGLAVVAWSVVPFALQIGYNEVFSARGDGTDPLPTLTSWWLLDDAALGPPQLGPWFTPLNPYEGASAVGTTIVLLCVVFVTLTVWGAIRRDRPDSIIADVVMATDDGAAVRRTTAAFWGVAAAIMSIAIYVGGPILEGLALLPGIAGNPIGRLRFVLNLAVVVVAVAGLDLTLRILERRGIDAGTVTDAVAPRRRGLVGAGAALVFALGVSWPMLSTLGTYRITMINNRDVAIENWGFELAQLVVGLVVVGLVVRFARGRARADGWLLIGVMLAFLTFAQVGLPMRNFSPQVDRAFYFPTTDGTQAMASISDRTRLLGSGMGTFKPNTAMIEGFVDARSHAFQDPQWEDLITAAFPDAYATDALKINIDFRGPVAWGSPVLDDLALGMLVMSSSEVPLGDAVAPPDAVTWETVTPDVDISGTGPIAPLVGVDLRLRGNSACVGGTVAVTTRSADGATARSTRPADDARFATINETTVPFAVALDRSQESSPTTLTVSLEGGAPDCEIAVGMTSDEDPTVAAGTFARPVDADWFMAGAEQGWYYARPSAHDLLRVVGDWQPAGDAPAALALAISPERTKDDPLPVSGAGSPGPGSRDGTVSSWQADGSGITATVDAPTAGLVVAAFNHAPGWRVYVDGTEQTLVQPVGALLGVEVPAGTHEVRFVYAMPGLRLGVAASAAALLAAAGLGGLAARSARRRN